MSTQRGIWTTGDSEGLRRCIVEGGSASRASVRFRRSVQAVRAQAKLLGLRFPTIRERRLKVFGPRVNNLSYRR
jgi:hypothetical protein